jgi:hypothetical protein
MADENPEEVTLNTLHEDLKDGFADLKGEVRDGFADLKTTLITGFRNMPTREDSQEMIRLLRENNRTQEGRFTQLDLRIREQHFELQQALRVLADSNRGIAEGVRGIADGVRALLEGQRALHEDIRALIARLDALIKGRGDGEPSP